MNKKILIGSIIAVVILLLMPSISAIQTNVVKEDIKGEVLKEKLDEIKELFDSEKLDNIKHPILYLLAYTWALFRGLRFEIIASFAYDAYECEWGWELDVHYPILTLRCILLLITTGLLINFLNGISDILGWNWNLLRN